MLLNADGSIDGFPVGSLDGSNDCEGDELATDVGLWLGVALGCALLEGSPDGDVVVGNVLSNAVGIRDGIPLD